jgi:hypothetical protein
MEHNIPGKGLRRAVGKELTGSQLFPVMSQGPQLLRKGALVPAAAVIVAGATVSGAIRIASRLRTRAASLCPGH